MAKLVFSAFSTLLLAALQVGCASAPRSAGSLPSHVEALRPACDTSVRVIQLAARIRNSTDGDIQFHLDDNRGPPFDPWYMGYRVHSAAPGEAFRLVHNSGHDAVWDRTLTVAPREAVDFNVPIFGLKPVDYLRYYRIEVRDSKGRSFWTPVFDLCSVSQAKCACPRLGAMAVGSQARRQACPVAQPAGLADNASQIEVGVDCR